MNRWTVQRAVFSRQWLVIHPEGWIWAKCDSWREAFRAADYWARK